MRYIDIDCHKVLTINKKIMAKNYVSNKDAPPVTGPVTEKKDVSDTKLGAKEPKSPVKTPKIPPIWGIFTKARKDFEVQIAKSAQVKCQCVEKHMVGKFDDRDKFWSDFEEQAERLLNSKMFCKEGDELCYGKENKLTCKAEILAEHIVFLGSATINKVLKNGIKNTIGNDYKLYIESFSTHRSDKQMKQLVQSTSVGA